MYGGQLIREARLRSGLTQCELADRAQTTQSAIARWETRRTSPSLDTVLRLVRLCGLDLEVSLVEADDSDLAQAQTLLALSPAERLGRGLLLAQQMSALQGVARGS